MKNFRVIGSTIAYELSEKGLRKEDLEKELNCSDSDIDSILKGRKICSFQQIVSIADFLKIDPSVIIDGNEQYYKKSIVHCMTDFKSDDNREQILDDIYDYLDLLDMVELADK